MFVVAPVTNSFGNCFKLNFLIVYLDLVTNLILRLESFITDNVGKYNFMFFQKIEII